MSQTNAVVQTRDEDNQLSLLDFGNLTLEGDILTVFKVNNRTKVNKLGLTVPASSSLTLRSRKDAATEMGLENTKENKNLIDAEILSQRDQLKEQLVELARIIDKNPNYTGSGLMISAKGNVALKFGRIQRGVKLTDEQTAQVLNEFAQRNGQEGKWTAEAVRVARTRQIQGQAGETAQAA